MKRLKRKKILGKKNKSYRKVSRRKDKNLKKKVRPIKYPSKVIKKASHIEKYLLTERGHRRGILN